MHLQAILGHKNYKVPQLKQRSAPEECPSGGMGEKRVRGSLILKRRKNQK